MVVGRKQIAPGSLRSRVGMTGDTDLGHALASGAWGASITSVTFRGLPFRFNLEVQTCVSRSLLSRPQTHRKVHVPPRRGRSSTA